MPLPIILAVGAAIAGASGVGAGISGGVKMKKANDKVKEATERDKITLPEWKESKMKPLLQWTEWDARSLKS